MGRGARAPGFVTHHALEEALGGGAAGAQQRRRLTERGLLPEPRWGRVDRMRLALYPDLILLSLVGSRPQQDDELILREAVDASYELMRGDAFSDLVEAATDAVRETRAIDLLIVVQFLSVRATDILDRWHNEVDAALESLRDLGAGLESELAKVVDVEPNLFVLDFFHGERLSYPLNAALSPLDLGACVARERFFVTTKSRDFIVPAATSVADVDELAADDHESDVIGDADHAGHEETPADAFPSLAWVDVEAEDWEQVFRDAASYRAELSDAYWDLGPTTAAQSAQRPRGPITLADITTDWGQQW